MTIVHYGRVVWRHRWLVLGLSVLTVVITLVVSMQLPKVYEATVTLLVPRETTPGGLLGSLATSGLVQNVPGVSLPSLTPNRDILLSILKSRTVAQAVVERFGLRERYRVEFKQEAIRALESVRSISVSKEGVVVVRLEDVDPLVAAQIANFHVAELDRLVAQFGIGEASRQRVFLTEQVTRARHDLERSENVLRAFQERNRAVVLQEQTRGAIETAARLKGEIMAADVQLQVMRSFATDNNPEVVSLKRRVDEMRRQLAQMQYGESLDRGNSREASNAAVSARPEIHVPFVRMPEVGLELARRTRELKAQETLVTLLGQQLEQARLAEARDMPLVRVLDAAVPAERFSRPRLKLNLAAAAITSLLAGIFLAFLIEQVQAAKRLGERP